MELNIVQFVVVGITILCGISGFYFWIIKRKKTSIVANQTFEYQQNEPLQLRVKVKELAPKTILGSKAAKKEIDITNLSSQDNSKTNKTTVRKITLEPLPANLSKPDTKTELDKSTFKQAKPVLVNTISKLESPASDLKFVNFEISIAERRDSYPILRYPAHGTIVRSYKIGRTKLRGHKEERFQQAIQHYFGQQFEILGDARINTGADTRPFEPDIAIVELSRSTNLRIDIEIDEPYASLSRQPIHCIGEDINRDNYFLDRGWVLIRFTEHQVHVFEAQCLSYIAQIIKNIFPAYIIPTQLQSLKCDLEGRWDIVQAQKWEIEKYREKYLNHDFTLIAKPDLSSTAEGLTAQEKEEENKVKDSTKGTIEITRHISYNLDNCHTRDSRIKFYPEPHLYKINDIPAPSVSTIIAKFFPEFDSVKWSEIKSPELGMTASEVQIMWADKGSKAATDGHFLHEQIENFYLKKGHDRPEGFHLFDKFHNDHIGLKPYRSEWRIFDEEFHIAGTVDLIAKTPEGYEMYDWKRSKKVVNPVTGEPIKLNKWQSGIGELNVIADTSYNRYCLQQSLYKYILEKNYGIQVAKMYLVVLYPEYERYYKVSVPYLKDQVKFILKSNQN